MSETLKIYVWPDGSWESEEEIDDMDWYLTSLGKSDDYAEYKVPIELDAEDIEELIELEALPGMIAPPIEVGTIDGIIELPPGSLLVVTFTEGENTPFTTHLPGKMIIDGENMTIEVLKGK